MIDKVIECPYVIHEDNFTETMDGITYLLKTIKEGGNASEAPICRAIILMSHFMIENIFWNTTSKFIKKYDINISQGVKDIIRDNLKRKIGISEAIEKWPKLLVGKDFDFSKEPFSSMKCLIKERNDVTHQDRISYYSYYIDSYDGAASAYYTAIECAKGIKKHFNEGQIFFYHEFEKVFPPPTNELFQKALSKAKSNSIRISSDKKFLDNIKTLDEYKSTQLLDFLER